jgi:hypothetical protein
VLRLAALSGTVAGALALAFAGAAGAQTSQLFPGVTYQDTIQFTPHGPVAVHVVKGPRPTGLYRLSPVLSNNTVTGRETVSSMERRLSSSSTTVGVNGDLFSLSTGRPSGILLHDGVLVTPPNASRSSAGITLDGTLDVRRIKFLGTWRGTGQRRTLNFLNQSPGKNGISLFTSDWGRSTPRIDGSIALVLSPFPAATPNADLAAPVVSVAQNSPVAIAPGTAVLVARGIAATKLQAEAPVGTTVTLRLILQPGWGTVSDAIGGGPILVRSGKPVYRSNEAFTTSQLAPRGPRSAVGQLKNGSIVLVATDGRQPGYSVGMTNFELAQTLVRLGAVTASAVDAGGSVTVAFDGQLLNRPSDGAERAVKEGLFVKYYGVYALAPSQAIVTAATAPRGVNLGYKIVRPSTVTATLTGPDGVAHPFEQALVKQPGTYTFPWTTFDVEGTWRFDVQAVDDLQRQTTMSRTFSYDLTLADLRVPASVKLPAPPKKPKKGAKKPKPVAGPKPALVASFSLSRPARVFMRIETRLGTIVKTLPAVQRPAGESTLRWDLRIGSKTLAFPGSYTAHVYATSQVGKMDLRANFALRK